MESLAFRAFVMGIVSACSLPLGALTSALWKPGDRALAFLMAFGGGALLAALTIDLVASSLEKGHFAPLICGCILGGLLFIVLNQEINERGGFLRKASTTIYYLRGEKRRRFKHMLSRIGRLDVFRALPSDEVEHLSDCVRSHNYRKGTTIYRWGDPGEYLYIIEEGQVELLVQPEPGGEVKRLGKNDAFGLMAFFSGAVHTTTAVARSNTRLWTLSRTTLKELLKSSSELAKAMRDFVESEELMSYLVGRQRTHPDKAREWVGRVCDGLEKEKAVPDLFKTERREREFLETAREIKRLPIFQRLPDDEIQEMASRIFIRRHEKGYTFFHQDEPAERMYIVKEGEVALVDPRSKKRTLVNLKENDAFGGMAFLTGGRHTVTALASTDVTVWVLRKHCFNEILQKSSRLEEEVRDFLKQEQVSSYLVEKKNFDPEKAARWTRKAIKNMEAGKYIPPVTETDEMIKAHHAAPLAIWLGIMLDGIPESLVIGSSLIHASVSFSLMAGLFLSNYPEALSSSVGMSQQGMSFKRILFMWTSLMVITGIGAAVGNLFFMEAPPFLFSLVEGLAAGAMLTMIAETMLPEAYLKGGSIIGFSTLLGFLCAISVKMLE